MPRRNTLSMADSGTCTTHRSARLGSRVKIGCGATAEARSQDWWRLLLGMVCVTENRS